MRDLNDQQQPIANRSPIAPTEPWIQRQHVLKKEKEDPDRTKSGRGETASATP